MEALGWGAWARSLPAHSLGARHHSFLSHTGPREPGATPPWRRAQAHRGEQRPLTVRPGQPRSRGPAPRSLLGPLTASVCSDAAGSHSCDCDRGRACGEVLRAGHKPPVSTCSWMWGSLPAPTGGSRPPAFPELHAAAPGACFPACRAAPRQPHPRPPPRGPPPPWAPRLLVSPPRQAAPRSNGALRGCGLGRGGGLPAGAGTTLGWRPVPGGFSSVCGVGGGAWMGLWGPRQVSCPQQHRCPTLAALGVEGMQGCGSPLPDPQTPEPLSLRHGGWKPTVTGVEPGRAPGVRGRGLVGAQASACCSAFPSRRASPGPSSRQAAPQTRMPAQLGAP